MKFHTPISVFLSVSLMTIALAAPVLCDEDTVGQEKKKTPIVTEEIVVTAMAPQDRPLATISVILPAKIEAMASRNLSEVLAYTAGTHVSVGGKGESHLKIRGLDNDKSTLLVDGMPVYEPYFNMYDLKTVLTEDVESIKVVKGASSVLYGANTMGGIVEVLTRRPQAPSLTLRTGISRDSNYIFSATGAASWKKTVFQASVTRDHADGMRIKDGDGTSLLSNSEYGKTSLAGKIYFYPSEKSEILAQASYYTSDYGVPDAMEYYSSRYWKFKEWKRLSIGLGGTFPLFKEGSLKVRTYFVRMDNTLDAYKNSSMSLMNWESIYKDTTAGAFVLGTTPLDKKNTLRFSLNAKSDHVEQQGSATSPWENYEHRTFSTGVEDEFRLTKKWAVIGGLSLDVLDQQSGKTKTSVNPIAGVKFNPASDMDIHLTYSQKSRFPSMRSLYSTSGGNPNLRDETGQTLELGAAWTRFFTGSVAVFTTEVKDLIQSVRLSSGYKTYTNIGKARISGFELETGKNIGRLCLQANYTYLNTKNKDENRRLELIPQSQLNLFADWALPKDIHLVFWALSASHSEVMINKVLIKSDAYVLANASLEKTFGAFALYLKVENLFNKIYFTEPGYATPSRRIEAGFRIRLQPESK